MDQDTKFKNAVREVITLNSKVCECYKYECGIVDSDVSKLKDGKAQFFFLSPDMQNLDFYQELRKAGWSDKEYDAHYFWKVEKDGVSVQYVEGGVYINLIK